MPTFRTQPSRNLGTSIRALLASGGGKLTPLMEAQADSMAAQTAQHMGLAEKARAEAEQIRSRQAAQADPAVRTEYAAHASGVDLPDANRLMGAIRGNLEQPGVADQDDAAMIGNEAQPFPMGRPNLQPGQEGRFRSALAAAVGNRIATGNTNAEQLAKAGGEFQTQDLTGQAAGAETVPDANRLIAAARGRIREPFSNPNAQGVMANKETGELSAEPELHAAAVAAANALAQQRDARADPAARRRQVIQTEAGPMQIDEEGNASPILGLDGEPVKPKKIEKALPTSAASKLFENQQNLRRAEQALALIKGESLPGPDGATFTGDPNATGKKGLLHDFALQRMDPKGVDTRAAIGDLGSLVIHDRSGAAVTAAEFPRLRPFIPLVTDDPKAAKKKLDRFVQEYRNVVQETTDFYRESGYRVPDETLRPSGAGQPDQQVDRRKAPSAWSIKRVE